MDFTYNEKTVMSSGGFIPSTNDTPLDARGRVNLYSEIKDIPNPYVGMEIRVLQDETNEGKMTKYKVTKLLPNEFGVPNSYIDTDTLEKISESLSDEDLVFDGICEDELGVITPQLKTDYNLTTTDKTIVGAINELKEALANITIGDDGEAVNLPFNSIDKGLASSNIDFSEIKNGNYCYIIRGTIGYDIPDGNLPLNNDMVHITKSNTAMTIITLSGGIYTYNGGTNGTDYISCTKDNFMTYSVASETYQLKNDSKLITTDKTVVGAINELKNALDSGVNGVSTILTVSPTYEELDTLPEGSKVYILNGLGYNGDPVHINKSSDTITLISIDGVINKYQKVGSSWSNYSTENWATQKYVDTAIANVQLGGESGSVDLSEYQKITDSSLATTNKNIVGAINEVKSSVDGITVPTKTSDLTNDSGFITSIPSEYITETELETKGYLTEHQSLTDYAKKTDIPDVSDFLTEVPAGYVTDTKLSTELDKKVNKEVGKGLSTNDLTNELVTKINSSATEAFVTNAIANAQLDGKEVDLSGYAKTSDIPTKTSDLNNDSGFIGYPDVIVIDKGSMDAEVDLDNDIPLGCNTILLTGRVVYNTYGHELVFVYRDRESSDSFIIYTMRGDKVVVSKSNGNWSITSNTSFIYRDNANSLYQKITDNTLTTTAKTIPTAINELKSGLDGIKVPTKTSELTNNSGFITTIPDEYITETELNAKGYLTSHQDISGLQTKTDNSLTTTDKTVIGAINELKTNVDGITVPTKVSDLENDSNFVTNSKMLEAIANAQLGSGEGSDIDLSVYQPIEESTLTTTAKTIPTAINELKSGLDGIKVPINISELNNDSGYLTSHQDISNLQSKTDNSLTTTDKTVPGAINEVNGNLLDTVGFSADYKNIILNRKSGLNPYTIPISAIINNASLAELKDIDSTDIGNGKTLIYDAVTGKHKYVGSTGTDELVKMDSTTDANYLSDLIDKSTVVNDNGVLKVKKLDGQEVTITEINYLKGLTMNVMDLVSAFANGGVKVWETPVNTYSDLSTLDRSVFIDGISYIVYVLIDETHSNAKTTYLCTKTSTTFFGNADSQRNFTTNPIDLANEVTGKLDNSHIDVDSLWTLLTINDTYKTLTTNNEIFGTHGAKAMYDELTTEIGEKANTSDIPTKVSELTNDSNYQTANQVNSAVTTAIAKVETELNGNIEEKIGNIDNLKLKNLGGNVDANNCRIADRNINGVYGYYGLFTQNVPMEGYAIIRCYQYGSGIRQFIDYTTSNNTKTYTRLIQYNGSSPTAWKELATMDKVKDIPKTTLTPVFPGEVKVASGGVAINYIVRNGWCNVNFEFNLASATTFSWTSIANGLPKPANNVNILLTDESGKINRTIAIKINSTGSVSSRIPVAFTAVDWWTGNISYPVAES